MSYKLWHTIPVAERERITALVSEKLPAITRLARRKGWPADALAAAEDYLLAYVRREHGIKAVVINDSYLLLYVVGRSWWSTKPFLCEEFLLSLGRGGDFGACLDAIERIAQDEGCGSVCVGTAAAPSNEAYARLLNRHGYKTLAYQLVKEVAMPSPTL